MLVTRAEEKARKGAGKHPCGSWCRAEGDGTQGIGHAGSAEPARLIGNPECGQGRQIGEGGSLGGLLDNRQVFQELLRGTARLNLAALPF